MTNRGAGGESGSVDGRARLREWPRRAQRSLHMTTQITDIDDFTIPPFSVLDGIEGAYADDDRAVDLWSHYHANRVVTMLRILRSRIRVYEWQVADVAPRGHSAATARSECNLADTRAELAAWETKRDALEKARVADWYAPKSWSWE